MDFKNQRPEYYQQLAMDLQIEEEEPSPAAGPVPPEEAKRRSETARQALELQQGETPAWMEEYLQLREEGWPWRVAAYIAWAASPRKTRCPKTQQMLASEVLGLNSDRVIGTWRSKNPAIDECVALLQAAPLLQHRRDIYDALITSASDPTYRSHQDRKLALAMLGDYVPRSRLDVHKPGDPEDLSDLSDAELDLLAERVIRQADETRRTGMANSVTPEASGPGADPARASAAGLDRLFVLRGAVVPAGQAPPPGGRIRWRRWSCTSARAAGRELGGLMIFEPPRHGKTEQVSRLFPSWLLGQAAR